MMVSGGNLMGMTAQEYQQYVQQMQAYQSAMMQGIYNGGLRQASAANYSNSVALPNFSAGALYTGPSIQGLSTLNASQNTRPKHEGINLGEIIAWRCWKVHDECLTSVYIESFVWAPGDVLSGKPDEGLGIHAWKQCSGALSYAKDYVPHVIAYGKVALWGEVTEHETGYRAEYARVVSVEGLRNHRPARRWFRRTPDLLATLKAKYEIAEARA